MLTEVSIKNFRALKDVTLKLGPLTVLVGPTATGKSSVLRAFDPAHPVPADVWRHDASRQVSFHYRGESGLGGAVSSNPTNGPGDWGQRPYAFQLLRLELEALRTASVLQPQALLAPDGSGIANVFRSLTRTEQSRLADEFCRLVPVFRDVDTRAIGTAGQHELAFQDRWDESVWYGPREVSDGSMLMLAYLLVGYQKPRPSLLAIEEPERGLHPYLMGEFVGLLRGLTTGPAPIQVLLATHSAEFLEYVDPEEVRFLTKDSSDGSVRIEQVSKHDPNWESAWEAHERSLSSVWLSGGVGGVPGI